MKTKTLTIGFSSAAAIVVLVSSTNSQAIPMPDSSSCASPSVHCLAIQKTNGDNSAAISGTGVSYGIVGLAAGTGVKGTSTSSTGTGVYGNATAGGVGVRGSSTLNDGVSGASYDSTHSGVAGLNYATSDHAIGVFGYSASSSGFAIWSSGNLQVTGTPYCSGCTTFTSNSDIRLKKNVQPLENTLQRLLKLRGVGFEWKDPAEQGGHTGMQRGFIAQEVENVFPEWVGVDNKGFKTLNLTGLEPMLVESLRALKTENDALRAADAKLEERIKVLEGKRSLAASFGDGTMGVAFLGAMAGIAAVSRKRARKAV